jgi:hypothetical protein
MYQFLNAFPGDFLKKSAKILIKYFSVLLKNTSRSNAQDNEYQIPPANRGAGRDPTVL